MGMPVSWRMSSYRRASALHEVVDKRPADFFVQWIYDFRKVSWYMARLVQPTTGELGVQPADGGTNAPASNSRDRELQTSNVTNEFVSNRPPALSVTLKRPGRHRYISWIRAIAAAEVLFWHSDLVTKHFSTSTVIVPPYTIVGAIGVDLFFVLSGYIMCMRATSYQNGGQYLYARLLRLVPMYWIFTCAVILAYLINKNWHLGGFDLSVSMVLRSYLMLPGWGFPILSVGWTLEYEMIFYVLVAFLAVGVGRPMARTILFAVVFGLGLAGMMVPATADEVGPLASPIGHVFSVYMLTFAAGWLIRLVEENGGARRNWHTIIGILVIFSLGLYQAGPGGAHLGLRAILAAGCFLLFQLLQAWFETNNLANRFVCLLGDSSYSIYLSHWFILSILGKSLGKVAPAEFAAWPLRMSGIAIALGVGVGAYLLLERPIDRFLRRQPLPWRNTAREDSMITAKPA
jgi:exopolysaccharide production protein ExoZ